MFIAVVVSLLTISPRFIHVNSATSDAKKIIAIARTKPLPPPVEVTLTAYVPQPGSITRSGIDANSRPGIASHNKVLPLGTQIVIPKAGRFLVDDRIPAGKAEAERYAITKNDLREGKRIHLDLRILPRYRKGVSEEAAYQEAVDLANRIGRRTINVHIIPPRTSTS